MPQIILAAVAYLLSALRQYLPGIVGRVLLAFGMGYVSHEFAFPAVKAFIESKFGQLPPVLQAYWGATGMGIATTMLISAWIAGHTQRAVLSKIGTK